MILRTLSLRSGTRVQAFCHSMRDRDRRCVITGRPGVIDGVSFWSTLDATHIFPLAYEKHWNDCNYSRWITVPPASGSDGSINSVQNGILIGADIHVLFDSYDFSINGGLVQPIANWAKDGRDRRNRLEVSRRSMEKGITERPRSRRS